MIWLSTLLVAATALLVLTLATARRPIHRVPDFDGYLVRWSPLHGGYEPRGNRWVVGWLRVAYALSRPLAHRGVLPDIITLWGAWFGFAVVVAAQAGGRWPLLAAWILVASGLMDALDGCVAVLTERTSRWGYVLDSVVDRVVDAMYLLALVAVGGSFSGAVVAGLAFFLLEYLRARAGNAGVQEIAVVTIGERPTRLVLCALGLFMAGLFAPQAELLATAALGAVALVSAIGVGQLGVAVRRRLVGQPG